MLQYKVVTPDGIIRIANACQNPDLFWALRGGGGGTFGLVLEATHAVEPRLDLAVVSIKFTQTADNVGPWLEILVNNSLQWAEEGWGGHYRANNIISVTPLLTLPAAQKSMQVASDFALANNGTAVIEILPSWYEFYIKYVTSNAAPVGNPNIVATRLIPASVFASDSGRVKLLAYLYRMLDLGLSPYVPTTTPYLFPYEPGSTSATPSWRDTIWSLGYGAPWAYNSTAAERKAVLQKIEALDVFLKEVAPDSGAYMNEAYAWTKDWKREWFGDNYDRLLEIKRKYDPDGLLSCWKCVGFEESDAEEKFPCYAGMD